MFFIALLSANKSIDQLIIYSQIRKLFNRFISGRRSFPNVFHRYLLRLNIDFFGNRGNLVVSLTRKRKDNFFNLHFTREVNLQLISGRLKIGNYLGEYPPLFVKL